MAIKLKQPEVIEATYRIVTPMFIGDADQKATGISPASVKGALRFWWRALNWGLVREKTSTDEEALKLLHSKENELFGSSTGEGKAAPFVLRIDATGLKLSRSSDWPPGGNNPSGYLGIGLWESGDESKGNDQAHREYISENQTFQVSIIAKELSDNKKIDLNELKDALLAWGLFGGLGSRSRRAFGSVAIEKLDNELINFSDIEAYKNQVEKLFSQYRLHTVGEPPFSAFSCETKFGVKSDLQNNSRMTHATLGQTFKNYRGVKDAPIKGEKKKVFGLPFAGGASKEEKEGRRGSPLFFHIHPIGKSYTAAALCIPAEFHREFNLDVDFTLITNFLKYAKMETV